MVVVKAGGVGARRVLRVYRECNERLMMVM
jgi:hypothetical protein